MRVAGEDNATVKAVNPLKHARNDRLGVSAAETSNRKIDLHINNYKIFHKSSVGFASVLL
jgi:hypothetical protein